MCFKIKGKHFSYLIYCHEEHSLITKIRSILINFFFFVFQLKNSTFKCGLIFFSEKLLMYRLFEIRRPSPVELHDKNGQIDKDESEIDVVAEGNGKWWFEEIKLIVTDNNCNFID